MLEKYALHRDLYLRYALKICGDSDKAEDLVQDTYLKLHDQIIKYPEKEFSNGFIYLMLKSVYIDGLRKKGVESVVYEIIKAKQPEENQREEVHQTLMEMPFFEREILIGCYEHRITDFAKMLGVHRKSIWRWKKDASREFKELWQKNYEGQEI